MTIKGVARVETPDDVNLSITITMPAGEWRRLMDRIDQSAYPGWPVAVAIRQALDQFSGAHYATAEYER